MPKLLFSSNRFNEIKDLMQNVKQPRRLKIILNPKRRKKNMQGLMAQKTKDDARPSKLSRKNGDKLQPTLEKLLKDKKHLAAFHSFLRSEFSEENIEFWLACEDFKATASTGDLRWRAEEIYREFIQPVARREINVDHHIREKIRTCLTNPGLSCFDEAQKHVYLLMERGSCPRFLQSDAYLRLQDKSRTLWYI
ncbi:regulator of G-protein signaling 21 [Brachionichthys hirsutus]|uniref:regulator of G-protein signaling 21 n=1 Tax=Brachionichthys hirsutus TaxID=412623 RepID=UPI0036044BFB